MRISVLRLCALFSLTLCHAADNSWDRVKELKSGSEIRIIRKGLREPLLARFDEANDERVLIVSKNAQMAVEKDEVERLDARPAPKPGAKKATTTSTATTTNPDHTPHPAGGVPVPQTSYGSAVSFGSGKGEFETIYRRVTPSGKLPDKP
jgi:hypothetical protein